MADNPKTNPMNDEDPKSRKDSLIPDRQKVTRQVATVGVGGNIFLAAFKLFAGIFGNSTAMISDAVHSLSDVFATAIALVGVRLAERDADSDHPYGHERFESVASLALGLILLFTGLAIGYSSLESITTGSYLNTATPSLIALIAAIVSIVAKEGMFWYTRHWARVINSSAFMADAWHHRSDALSSVGALAGIGASMLGFHAGDAIASLVICVIILKVAFDVLKESLSSLTDTACDSAFEHELGDVISNTPGVIRSTTCAHASLETRYMLTQKSPLMARKRLFKLMKSLKPPHDAVESHFDNVKHIMIHENPA